MTGNARLQSITDAELAVVPWPDRTTTLALAGVPSKPPLRAVPKGAESSSGFADRDILLGLFAKVGLQTHRRLVGSVMIRDILIARSLSGKMTRLVIINAPIIAGSMSGWRPPLRALLIATAAMIVATTANDSACRTHVACLEVAGDPLSVEAIDLLGGRALTGPSGEQIGLVDGALAQLRFLDAASAAKSAKLLLEHVDGEVRPAKPIEISGVNTGEVEGLLSIGFPRAIRSLRDEIAEIGHGRVSLEWRIPIVAYNDAEMQVQRTTHAAAS